MYRRIKLLIEALFLIGFTVLFVWFLSKEESDKKNIEVPSKLPLEFDTTNPTVGTTKRLQLSKPGAYPGFTLVPESGTAKVHLVNMSGDRVKSWDFDAARARLLPNCNLLVVHGTKWGWSQEYWSKQRKHAREFDWSGNVVWEYTAPGPVHHDIRRLENGNNLFQYRRLVPPEFTKKIEDPKKREARIRTDSILEVTQSGKVVWEWDAHIELDLNSCGAKPCPKTPKSIARGKRTFDWTHNNTTSIIPKNRHFDSGDTRFRPGNIMILPRSWSQTLIIDKLTKKIVWRYSGNYEGGLSGGHESQIIPKGLPGAGNLLLFDNGRERTRSVVLEIDPVTEEVLWSYNGDESFYSPAAGAVQRLPNGNTLISLDVPGRVLEVNGKGELLWAYHAGIRTARAKRYRPDHCPNLLELPLF